jgi:hypothetical protein
MAKKRKTLPKEFNDLLESGNMEALKKVFDKCELDAYHVPAKQTAIAFCHCPDELVRWLVEQGADLHKGDYYGDTPIHQRALKIRPQLSWTFRCDSIFPLTMKLGFVYFDTLQFIVGYFFAFWVFVFVQLCLDSQTFTSRCITY